MKVVLNDKEQQMFLEYCQKPEQALNLIHFILTARVVENFGDSTDLKRQLTDLMWDLTHCFDSMPMARKGVQERADVANVLRKMFDVVEAKPEIEMRLPKSSPEADQVIIDALDRITAKVVLKFSLRWFDEPKS